jgi:hypothetical protein
MTGCRTRQRYFTSTLGQKQTSRPRYSLRAGAEIQRCAYRLREGICLSIPGDHRSFQRIIVDLVDKGIFFILGTGHVIHNI